MKKPTNDGKILNLANKNHSGIVKYGAAIPLTLVDAVLFLAAITAMKNTTDNFNACRQDVRNAYQVYDPAIAALADWLAKARRSLVGIFGTKWSADWAAAGFVNNTTGVPLDNEGRIALGLALQNYYTKNPTSERPDDDVTALQASVVTTAATTAQTTVLEKEQALRDADNARRPAKATLLRMMSSLVKNLKDKLASDDPRWLAFGLEMPSTNTTPGKMQNVTAAMDTMGNVVLQGDPEPYGQRYRGRMMILGVDTKYRLVFSNTTPLGLIPGLQPGTTVQFVMEAVNGGSQGVASEPVLFTVPLMQAAAKPVVSEAELAPLAAIVPNGNGNGNGSHAVSRLS